MLLLFYSIPYIGDNYFPDRTTFQYFPEHGNGDIKVFVTRALNINYKEDLEQQIQFY